jgi:hypothetical protein
MERAAFMVEPRHFFSLDNPFFCLDNPIDYCLLDL